MISLRPDAARARALDIRMRERLADSLGYVFQQADGRLRLPAADERQAFLQRLRRGAVAPLVFGAYCDAVLAIEAGRLENAEALLKEVVASANDEGLDIEVLGDPTTDPVADRYQRLIDTDPNQSFVLTAPDPRVAAACSNLVRSALDLIDRGHPALGEEIAALIRSIVLIDTDPDRPSDLTGASAFMLWGAVLLNARVHTDLVDLTAALAHESGHNVLFGLCADGPLIANDDLELYASPLRSDPRPMDGIVHAVYVIARMHEALSTLLASGVFSSEEAKRARRSLRTDQAAFARGREIVRSEGKLTDLGREVMAGVDAYMAGVFEPAH